MWRVLQSCTRGTGWGQSPRASTWQVLWGTVGCPGGKEGLGTWDSSPVGSGRRVFWPTCLPWVPYPSCRSLR